MRLMLVSAGFGVLLGEKMRERERGKDGKTKRDIPDCPTEIRRRTSINTTTTPANNPSPINTARAREISDASCVKLTCKNHRATSVTSSGASSSVNATLNVNAASTRPVAMV